MICKEENENFFKIFFDNPQKRHPGGNTVLFGGPRKASALSEVFHELSAATAFHGAKAYLQRELCSLRDAFSAGLCCYKRRYSLGERPVCLRKSLQK